MCMTSERLPELCPGRVIRVIEDCLKISENDRLASDNFLAYTEDDDENDKMHYPVLGIEVLKFAGCRTCTENKYKWAMYSKCFFIFLKMNNVFFYLS